MKFPTLDKNRIFKRLSIKVVLLTILVTAFMLSIPFIFSNDESSMSAAKTQAELDAEIKKWEGLINKAQQQAGSLSREIDLIEGNIQLKTVQIEQAEYQIEQKTKELGLLIEDIGLLEVRLDRLDETIDYHNDLLGKRLKRSYIDHQQSSFELLLSSDGVGDFLAKMKYLQEVEQQDKELIKTMADTKDRYEDQKTLLQEKKDEVEKIKKEIEAQKAQAEALKASLASQKQAKDDLLRITKNDEKRYQQNLEQAKKELSQIQSAASVVVREGKAVDVKEGEVIGTMGNSGFSTGAHLHFSVYGYSVEDFQKAGNWGWYYSNYKNPLDYLKKKTIKWGTGCSRDPSGDKESGKGSWSWPMASPRITQNFGGQTCYNWMYGGKVHPALDMVGIGDISIRAVEDGEAYFCRNCLGDGGNGVFIFHDNDKMTVYWHLK
jgi:peptidoglycan hydrolase CwlO-like protein